MFRGRRYHAGAEEGGRLFARPGTGNAPWARCLIRMLSACSEPDGASTLTVTVDPGVYFPFVDSGGATSCGAFQVDIDGLR